MKHFDERKIPVNKHKYWDLRLKDSLNKIPSRLFYWMGPNSFDWGKNKYIYEVGKCSYQILDKLKPAYPKKYLLGKRIDTYVDPGNIIENKKRLTQILWSVDFYIWKSNFW